MNGNMEKSAGPGAPREPRATAARLLFLLTMVFWSGCMIGLGAPRAEASKEEKPARAASASRGRGAGDTLRILNSEAPTILTPHLTRSIKDWEAGRITYEPLASFDRNGKLVLFLAEETPTLENGGLAADGRSVTWKLKKNVKWSDGKPFTADDVLFTWRFVTNPDVKAASAALYSTVEAVEVISPHSVKILFKDVNPAWSIPFVGIQGVILPRHLFMSYNGANVHDAPANALPAGTGPYRVTPPGVKPQEILLLGAQIIETNKIIFEPNPYFREPDKPFFRRIVFKGGGTVKEAGRLVMQLGEIDFAYDLGSLPMDDLKRLQTAGHGRLFINFGSKVDRIVLNRTDPNRETADGERSSLEHPHPLFGNKKVRQALAHAINRPAIAGLYGLTGKPTHNNLVAPPQYNSPHLFYEFDLEKAKSLLDGEGWIDEDGDGVREKGDLKMKIVFQTYISAAAQKAQQIVKMDLESIGIEVELKIVDSSIMFGPGEVNPDSIRRFNADIQEFQRRSVSPDPASLMRLWLCGQIPQKTNNWTGANYERWCNPEYDALYHRSTTEIDSEKRRELFIRMNDMLVEDVAMIPIVFLAEAHGVGSDIRGVDLTPWDANTWNIKDWRREKRK
ncbi:MAG: peptide ABC transporter substrate-binding protein [Desulfobacterales bacterium]|nr:peptide ABC transporter substrate-binding protein [Desulfobacterales bacterium]